MSPRASAARAALIVLEASPAGDLAVADLAAGDVALLPDEGVAALLEVEAAPLPAQVPRESARPRGAAFAALGLLVLGVFVGLPLLVVAGALLGVGATATAVTLAVVVAASAGLRGGRWRTSGRRAHARDHRDREAATP